MVFQGLKPVYPIYLANKPVLTKKTLPVIDKYSGKIATEVSLASEHDILGAIHKGTQAEIPMKKLASFERKQVLLNIAHEIEKRNEELARVLTIEVGKPIKDARVEIRRAIDTFTIAAEESVRTEGSFMELDTSARNRGYNALIKRFPIGLISMIVPFNFPINLAAHKIGPAIAAGNPFVLKPSDRTPVSAILLGEILASASKDILPEGAFSIVPCELDEAKHLSQHDSIKLLSFTGSEKVGWQLKSNAGKKKVTLELGGNAACIIDSEIDTKKLESIVDRLCFGAFYQAGQSCISVQRIFVHEALYDKVKTLLIQKSTQLKKGSPQEEDTFLGPLITEADAKRVENWVNSSGGTVLTGGKRDGCFYDATILENVSKKSELNCKEVFGPVCFLEKFQDFKQACEAVNDSAFGLQAGVFTDNIHKAFYAFDALHVGGVVINDIPSARVDAQPYGGVKDSGVGREGLRYAIEDFSELKIMLMKDIGKLN